MTLWWNTMCSGLQWQTLVGDFGGRLFNEMFCEEADCSGKCELKTLRQIATSSGLQQQPLVGDSGGRPYNEILFIVADCSGKCEWKTLSGMQHVVDCSGKL